MDSQVQLLDHADKGQTINVNQITSVTPRGASRSLHWRCWRWWPHAWRDQRWFNKYVHQSSPHIMSVKMKLLALDWQKWVGMMIYCTWVPSRTASSLEGFGLDPTEVSIGFVPIFQLCSKLTLVRTTETVQNILCWVQAVQVQTLPSKLQQVFN